MRKGQRAGHASIQRELPGMPKMSTLAEKATEYLNEREHLEEMQELLTSVKLELASEFRKAGVSKIRVAGCTIHYRHKEADSIIVKKDPENI